MCASQGTCRGLRQAGQERVRISVDTFSIKKQLVGQSTSAAVGGRGRWGGSRKGEGTWEREEELLGWRFDEDPGGGKAGVLGLLWERDV